MSKLTTDASPEDLAILRGLALELGLTNTKFTGVGNVSALLSRVAAAAADPTKRTALIALLTADAAPAKETDR